MTQNWSQIYNLIKFFFLVLVRTSGTTLRIQLKSNWIFSLLHLLLLLLLLLLYDNHLYIAHVDSGYVCFEFISLSVWFYDQIYTWLCLGSRFEFLSSYYMFKFPFWVICGIIKYLSLYSLRKTVCYISIF